MESDCNCVILISHSRIHSFTIKDIVFQHCSIDGVLVNYKRSVAQVQAVEAEYPWCGPCKLLSDLSGKNMVMSASLTLATIVRTSWLVPKCPLNVLVQNVIQIICR